MTALGSYRPRGKRRVIYVSDPSSIARRYLPDPTGEDALRSWIDDVGDAGVDTFIQEAYTQGWTTYWRSDRFEYDARPQHRRFLPLLDRGIQPLEILLEQCRQRGVEFLAGIRINDNHGHVSVQQGVGAGSSFVLDHPQWHLKQPHPGDYYKMTDAMDFSIQEVRDHVYSVIEELVNRFEVDGIELCFRDQQYFPHDKGPQCQPLMTELIQRVRKLLKRVGRGRGKRLVLGARVYQTLEECRDQGLDVPEWIHSRLIDYVAPADTMYSDINAPYETFAQFGRASRCMVYPTILPWSSIRMERRAARMPLTLDQQRALARNYFGSGADGVCFYNHFNTLDWAPFYPMQMSDFDAVRSPARAAQGRRHYVFEPIWGGCDGFGLDLACTGTIKADRIVLRRGDANASGRYRFRVCENLANERPAMLLFRAGHATPNDRLAIRINGTDVPSRAVRRRDDEMRVIMDPLVTATDRSVMAMNSGGIKAGSGDGDVMHEAELAKEGHPIIQPDIERANMTYWFGLHSPPAVYGDNWLEVTLDASDPQASGDIVIDEIEVFVV